MWYERSNRILETDWIHYIELAKEVGVELELENYDAIEEKLSSFAEVTGKSRCSCWL